MLEVKLIIRNENSNMDEVTNSVSVVIFPARNSNVLVKNKSMLYL